MNRGNNQDALYLSEFILLTVVSCGSPPSIRNGSPGTYTSILVGGTVTYSCYNRYVISGSATITCLANGSWETPPLCLCKLLCVYTWAEPLMFTNLPVITCPDLSPPSNSAIFYSVGSTDNRPVGTLALYNCDIGYTLIGENTRSCLYSQSWSGSAPTCEGEIISYVLCTYSAMRGLKPVFVIVVRGLAANSCV